MEDMQDNTTSEMTEERNRNTRPKVFTSKKVIIFIFFFLISAAAVITLIYFFAPNLSSIKRLSADSEARNSISDQDLLKATSLPKHVLPMYYRLRFHPNFGDDLRESSTFSGRVTIALDCLENTSNILLHAENLNVTKVEVTTSPKNQNLQPTEISYYDNKHEMIHSNKSDNGSEQNPELISERITVARTMQDNSKILVKLAEPLVSGGKYFLEMHFNGIISEDESGVFRTGYLDEFGKRKSFVSTNFRSSYARRAFPCFDEAEFRANFEISVAKRTNMVALSNTYMKETEAIDSSPGWVWNHFETSPPMPTHLLAFTVGEMKSVNASSKKAGPVIKLWARKPLLPQTRYASGIAADILDFLRDYLGTNFPLQKLDLAVVSGMVEASRANLGLILFSESALLLNEKSISSENRKAIFSTVARNIAHQWFDTLPSSNWSTSWMKLGLSIYLDYTTETALFNPSSLDNFGVEVILPTLSKDDTKGIKLISEKENEDVGTKAACIFRMLSESFGEKGFRKGLTNFLKNPTGAYFWNEMQLRDLLGRNFTANEVMATWMSTAGYPLITITRNYEAFTVKIHQVKFGNVKRASENWIVPLTYMGRRDSVVSVVVSDQSLVKINSSVGANRWMLFNINQIGYYRVNYDLENWNLLMKQLEENHTEIPVANRVQLISDAFALANADYIKHTIPFRLIRYLKKEGSYNPWRVTFDNLNWIEEVVSETSHFGSYKGFMLSFLKADQRMYNFSRTAILETLQLNKICELRHKACTTKAVGIFEKYYARNGTTIWIADEYKYMVYCAAIQSGSEDYWDFVWERSKNVSSFDKTVMYMALGCSRDTWKLTSYLEKTLSSAVDPEYVKVIWKSLSRKPVGRIAGMNFLENNWSEIHSYYKTNPQAIRTIIDEFLGNLSTEIYLQKVSTFFSKHMIDMNEMSGVVKAALDKIKTKIAWKKQFLGSVLPLLNNEGGKIK